VSIAERIERHNTLHNKRMHTASEAGMNFCALLGITIRQNKLAYWRAQKGGEEKERITNSLSNSVSRQEFDFSSGTLQR